jgi:tropomodulin
VAGVVRGKKWIPPPQDTRMQAAEEQIAIDLGDEYEQALTDATQEEIIDLAAILGFHQMVNVIAINCSQQFTRPFIKAN